MGKEFKKKKSTSEIIMQKEPKNKQVFFFFLSIHYLGTFYSVRRQVVRSSVLADTYLLLGVILSIPDKIS